MESDVRFNLPFSRAPEKFSDHDFDALLLDQEVAFVFVTVGSN